MLTSFAQKRLLLLLLLLLVGIATPVHALNFGAYWLYRQTGGDALETRQEFQQRYNLGVGPSFSYQPTRAISATARVSYSRSQADSGHGMSSTDQLTPTAQLSLANDIFLAQISGSRTIRKTATRENTSQSWDTTLASTWNIPLWPSIRFNYGERTDNIDSALKNTSSGVGVDWDLLLAKLSYQYRNSKDEDREKDSLGETDSHFARLESSGSFWDKRIGFNLAQQYQMATQSASQGSVVVLSGETWGKIDATVPTSLLYVDPAADPAGENLTTRGALSLVLGDSVHISFTNLDLFERSIDTLRIYTESSTAETLVWDLYVRDTANNWQQVVTSVPLQGSFVDDKDGQRIEIHLPNGLDAKEVLLVAHNLAGPLTFTKVEGTSSLATNFSGSSTDYLTNLSLRVRLTRTLNFSSNLTLEHANSEADGNSFTEVHRIMSGRLGWTPIPYLMPSLGFSENRDEQTGSEDQISRYYSLTVASIPLPSMHVVFGVTRTERYIGELKTTSSDKYSLTTRAQIYPDLSADLSFSQDNGEQTDSDGVVTNLSAFSTRLNLNALLLRGLTADFTTSYSNVDKNIEDGSGAESTENADLKLILGYRPSDLLALYGSYATHLLGSDSVDTYSLGMTLGLLRTDKTRLTLITSHQQANTTSDSFTLYGSWDISKNLSMLTRGSYTVGDANVYSVLTTLTLNL